jgi:hypothetical protein
MSILNARRLAALSRGLGRLAPIATSAVLLSTTLLPSERMAAGDARHAKIASAFAQVPHRLGSWVGVDVPVPTEAKEILRANAILSRRYQELNGSRGVTLALIHCVDVRDMTGHHPPVCYPAAGWSLATGDPEGATAEGAVTLASGKRVPIRLYRFVRADKTGGLLAQTVVNAFILPEGEVVADMGLLTSRAERRVQSAEGVAQIQFVFPGRVGQQAALAVAEEILSAMPPEVLASLGLREDRAPDAGSRGGDPSAGGP